MAWIGYHVGMPRSPVQVPDSDSDDLLRLAEQWLLNNTRLEALNRTSMARVSVRLTERLLLAESTCVGIAGAPGSGKSTLAALLVQLLNGHGVMSCTLCVDDYYLSSQARRELAGLYHPALVQRGLPGTHDLQALLSDLDAVSYTHLTLPTNREV